VKFFDDQKGFGFIAHNDGGEDIFAHRNNLADEHNLVEGDEVTYDEAWDDIKGQAHATNISGGSGGRGSGGREGWWSEGWWEGSGSTWTLDDSFRAAKQGESVKWNGGGEDATLTAALGSIEVQVTAPSGSVLFGPTTVSKRTTIGTLKDDIRAAASLNKRQTVELFTGSQVLHNGSDLASVVQAQSEVLYLSGIVTNASFALICWGAAELDEDVAQQLSSGVVDVSYTAFAFAAVKNTGAVVLWGSSDWDTVAAIKPPPSVMSQLSSGVVSVHSGVDWDFWSDRSEGSCEGAFAALKENGGVVTWGSPQNGGDCSAVVEQISSGVVSIYCNCLAFAAVKESGAVVTWGDPEAGGDSSRVAAQLGDGVDRIYSHRNAFAALKAGGAVVAWGNQELGGDASRIAPGLSSGVTSVEPLGATGFAAFKDSGELLMWGDVPSDSEVAPYLQDGVKSIVKHESQGVTSYVVVKVDGTAIKWGQGHRAEFWYDVWEVYACDNGYIALSNFGQVWPWGFRCDDWERWERIKEQCYQGVKSVHINCENYEGFCSVAALRDDGRVVTWGDAIYGGDATQVSKQIQNGVTTIFNNRHGYAALKQNGSVVTWGHPWGGNSQSVQDQLQDGVVDVVANYSSMVALKRA